MADESSSNVASVAIVILVILAGFALYFFVLRGGGEAVPDSPDIEVQIGGDGDGS